MEQLYLTIALAPLVGSVIAGFFGGRIGRAASHWITSSGVGISAALSLYVLYRFVFEDEAAFDQAVYTWMVSDGLRFEIGFLVDRLTALMMSVVTFVSFCVHIYTIGYMADDEHNWPKESLAGRNSYQRFFSYISLFTFSMLMLVMANNFLQLFFGWEAVGLVSYLLIGFWSVRETAIFANMKAFLVNRVGDFGFMLGIVGGRDVFRQSALRRGLLEGPGPGGTADLHLGRRQLVADDGDLHPAVHRRHGQVRPGAAARVAAGLDGRPDADLGPDPRRDHGHRRCLHGGAHVAAVRAVGDRAAVWCW